MKIPYTKCCCCTDTGCCHTDTGLNLSNSKLNAGDDKTKYDITKQDNLRTFPICICIWYLYFSHFICFLLIVFNSKALCLN